MTRTLLTTYPWTTAGVVIAGVCLAFALRPSPASAGRLDGAPKPAVADKVQDKFVPARYDQQTIEGLLGQRMRVNLEQRLLRLDTAPLLAGFQNRPGVQDWIGEHAGKFLHAASNTWAATGNEALKARMDQVAHGLIATQLPDGYLGTYVEAKRWGSWDVWVHKYDVIGLLAYYQVTGDRSALDACRKVGDLLCQTFGEGPGQRNLMASGTHVGMAPGSVLEPMCQLYRWTGDKKYLDFCLYITRAYDAPGGPKVIQTLTEVGSVVRTANAKAYEMLSNLVGLTELYRLTGDQRFLVPAVNAWKDITAHRLYVTGTSSLGEHFKPDGDLPGTGAVGEMCVTVTWEQLNWQLLRLTGEPQYADQLERTVYNALLGAQRPGDGQICYFTPLVGKKGYGSVAHGVQGVNCCISSGQRGISLIPQLAWGTLDAAPAVMLYTPGQFSATVQAGGKPVDVTLKAETRFPVDGQVTLTVQPAAEAAFPIRLRVPAWCGRFAASAGGHTFAGKAGGLLTIERTWKPGDTMVLNLEMTVQVLDGGKSYPECVAVQRGPQVLSLDTGVAPEPAPEKVAFKAAGVMKVPLADAPDKLPQSWTGTQAYLVEAAGGRCVLVPFADAGQTGAACSVWLGPQPKVEPKKPR